MQCGFNILILQEKLLKLHPHTVPGAALPRTKEMPAFPPRRCLREGSGLQGRCLADCLAESGLGRDLGSSGPGLGCWIMHILLHKRNLWSLDNPRAESGEGNPLRPCYLEKKKKSLHWSKNNLCTNGKNHLSSPVKPVTSDRSDRSGVPHGLWLRRGREEKAFLEKKSRASFSLLWTVVYVRGLQILLCACLYFMINSAYFGG